MQTGHNYKILFWLYEKRATSKGAPLYVRITINGKRVTISLNHYIDPSQWDKDKQKVTGRKADSLQINAFIDKVKMDLIQIHQKLIAQEKTITADKIKSIYLGEDVKHYTFSDIVDYHNKTAENKLSVPTRKHYKTSQRYTFEFIQAKYKQEDINLKELNFSFITGFESFLRTYPSIPPNPPLGNNTVMKHIQRLRKMIKMAFHMEWIDKDPFVKFKPTMEKKAREFLTEAELNRIKNFVAPVERLDLVKDLYLFSCYTGISFSDVMELTPDSIVKGIDGFNWIVFDRLKTKTRVKVPILPPTQILLDKYRDNIRCEINGSLLPIISNVKTNAYLKEIANICGIHKRLTYHMARHTFATTITLSNGVPIETVSKLLGHTKISTTQIYARVLQEKVSEDMKDLELKLSPPKIKKEKA